MNDKLVTPQYYLRERRRKELSTDDARRDALRDVLPFAEAFASAIEACGDSFLSELSNVEDVKRRVEHAREVLQYWR